MNNSNDKDIRKYSDDFPLRIARSSLLEITRLWGGYILSSLEVLSKISTSNSQTFSNTPLRTSTIKSTSLDFRLPVNLNAQQLHIYPKHYTQMF